jgi:hypothetical protein
MDEVFVKDHSIENIHTDLGYERVHLVCVLHVVGNRFGVDVTFHQNALRHEIIFNFWKNHLVVKLLESVGKLYQVFALVYQICLFVQHLLELVNSGWEFQI